MLNCIHTRFKRVFFLQHVLVPLLVRQEAAHSEEIKRVVSEVKVHAETQHAMLRQAMNAIGGEEGGERQHSVPDEMSWAKMDKKHPE
jgi:hypothetical protein